ncbi:hypothetical protein ES708_32661 [subsurface metagenome]
MGGWREKEEEDRSVWRTDLSPLPAKGGIVDEVIKFYHAEGRLSSGEERPKKSRTRLPRFYRAMYA